MHHLLASCVESSIRRATCLALVPKPIELGQLLLWTQIGVILSEKLSQFHQDHLQLPSRFLELIQFSQTIIISCHPFAFLYPKQTRVEQIPSALPSRAASSARLPSL